LADTTALNREDSIVVDAAAIDGAGRHRVVAHHAIGQRERPLVEDSSAMWRSDQGGIPEGAIPEAVRDRDPAELCDCTRRDEQHTHLLIAVDDGRVRARALNGYLFADA
jgi:hypothetical protein